MSPARTASLVAGLLASATLAGCSQSGSFLSQRTSVGSLKTSVAHLEFENQQLRREVATLKDENRDIENRLVQEESANGDLTARLDDARTLLGRRGLDGGAESSDSLLDPAGGAAHKTLPAGQSNRKRRKTPFAQIPGRIDVLPPTDTDAPSGSTPGWGKPTGPSGDDLGPTSQNDRSPLWLPVARGSSAPSRPLR
jgi:outer membrane murein-binding lipoprotein Lpp